MISLVYLRDAPEFIPIIASWYVQQWGNTVGIASIEKEEVKLKKYLQKETPPLIVVAIDHAKPIGAIQLKYREMSIYPDYQHWIGGVYVIPSFRGKGVAKIMIHKVIAIAKKMHIPSLYLQTEKLDGGLYKNLGWKPIHQVIYHGQEVVVMKNDLASNFKKLD